MRRQFAELTKLEQIAVRASLRESLAGRSWFNLGPFADLCRVLEIPTYTNSPEWKCLQALHCKEWTVIGPQGRGDLIELLLEVLGVETANQIAGPSEFHTLECRSFDGAACTCPTPATPRLVLLAHGDTQ